MADTREDILGRQWWENVRIEVPMTRNAYDGRDVPKIIKDGQVIWGINPRANPNPIVGEPQSLVGVYDLVSTSLCWRNDPCVTGLEKLSAPQREEMRKAYPALYEFLRGHETCLALWFAVQLPEPPVPSADAPSATVRPPSRNGTPSSSSSSDIAAANARPLSPLWPEATVREEEARHHPQVHRGDMLRHSHSLPIHGGPWASAASYYSGLRILLQRRMATGALPEGSQTTSGRTEASPPHPSLKYFHRSGIVTYRLAPSKHSNQINGAQPHRPTVECPIVWDSPFVGLPPPHLCFTAETDASPDHCPFACLTWQGGNPEEPRDPQYFRVIMILKKRSDELFRATLTKGERDALGIGLNGPELKTRYRAREQFAEHAKASGIREGLPRSR